MAASFLLSYPHCCCKRAGDVTKKRPASLSLSYKCRARSAFSNSYYVPDKEASILNSKQAQALEQPPQSQEAAAPSPPSGLGCQSICSACRQGWGAVRSEGQAFSPEREMKLQGKDGQTHMQMRYSIKGHW